MTDEGRFETPNASRYLQQLCKHFSHKTEVTFDEHAGQATLPGGPATLTATGAELVVLLEADTSEGLEQSRHVIDSHLERFAFREAFEKMDWAQLRS